MNLKLKSFESRGVDWSITLMLISAKLSMTDWLDDGIVAPDYRGD